MTPTVERIEFYHDGTRVHPVTNRPHTLTVQVDAVSADPPVYNVAVTVDGEARPAVGFHVHADNLAAELAATTRRLVKP